MVNRFECKVLGNPVPQARPRAFRAGNGIRMYDPATSKNWKETVKWQAISQKPRIFTGPLSLSLQFFLVRPKSLPKKVQHHTRKPDLDNLVKAVKDALKGICYRDDSQVISTTATKNYGDQPGVIISITEMEDDNIKRAELEVG